MKSTGITKKIDDLGRLIIPKEIRNTMNLNINDSLAFFIEGDFIILKKYNKDCIFCGNTENILNFKDKYVCKDCIKKLKNDKN